MTNFIEFIGKFIFVAIVFWLYMMFGFQPTVVFLLLCVIFAVLDIRYFMDNKED